MSNASPGPIQRDEREVVLELSGLTVRYGSNTAVDDASFTVRRGELFGFIGPNGAGKSTTMRVLATVQPLQEGSVRVLGHDVAEDPEWIRWRLGYMPDLFGMPDSLSVQRKTLSGERVRPFR